MKKILLVLSLTCSVLAASAQTNSIFRFNKPNGNSEFTNYLRVTTITRGEGNYMYGTLADETTPGWDDYLVKWDENETMIWQKKLDIPSNIYNSVSDIKFNNNYLYVLGTITYSSTIKYYLSKVDVNGSLQWTKILVPSDSSAYGAETPGTMTISNDHRIIVANYSQLLSIFSINEDGSTNWSNNYTLDFIYQSGGYRIFTMDNGDIMGCSNTNDYTVGMCFFRIDRDGQPVWARQYKDYVDLDHPTAIMSTLKINENKFLVCGFRYDVNQGLSGTKGYYAFTDTTCVASDYRLVNDDCYWLQDAFKLSNGNMVIWGYTGGHDTVPVRNIYLLINEQGDILSSYSGHLSVSSSSDSQARITENNGYAYIIEGLYQVQKFTSFSPPSTCTDLYPQSYYYTPGDQSGCILSSRAIALYSGIPTRSTSILQLNSSVIDIVVNCTTIGIDENSAPSLRIYPTLLTSMESIFVQHSLADPIEYHIIDINGKMVKQGPLVNNMVSAEGLSAGTYIIHFTTGNRFIQSGKFVVTE